MEIHSQGSLQSQVINFTRSNNPPNQPMKNVINQLPNRGIHLSGDWKLEDALKQRAVTESHPGFALNDALVPLVQEKHESFRMLATCIAGIANILQFDSPSILELGSGGGSLCQFIMELGIKNYLAVDGNPLIFDTCPFARDNRDHFRILNLEDEIDFGQKFDIVMTFEVLEHISETCVDNFVKTVKNHLHPGSIFIGTASRLPIPEHITLKANDWWIEKFSAHGLSSHPLREPLKEMLLINKPFNWGKPLNQWMLDTSFIIMKLA